MKKQWRISSRRPPPKAMNYNLWLCVAVAIYAIIITNQRASLVSLDSHVTTLNLTNAGLIGTLNLYNLTGALPSLNHLYLQGNSFSASDLSASSSCVLESLDLSSNNISDPLPKKSFLCYSLTSLAILFLILPGWPTLFPPCQNLNLLNFSDNKLAGKLATLHLSNIWISHTTNFSANFSSLDFGHYCNLTWLSLSQNRLSGIGFPLSLRNCVLLQTLNLSRNELQLKIPDLWNSTGNGSISKQTHWWLAADFCIVFFYAESESWQQSTLREFPHYCCKQSSKSDISEKFHQSLEAAKNLRSIDLSFNSLNGPIPLEVWTLPNLLDLVMWANNLTGEIPEGICVNRLTGEIPAGIGNLVNLAVLQMGNNSLTGKVPPEIGNCRSLIWLDLNSNNLSGPLPPELCRPCWSSCSWNCIREAVCIWDPARKVGKSSYGSLLSYNKNLFWHDGLYIRHKCSMIFLDLAYNSLSGTIPQNFGLMSYLQVLNLGHNKLTGNIPDSFGGLKAIGVLDLSHNDLQGFLPGSLGTLSFLSDLDVSNNNLTGPIPSGGQLTTFPQSRYENNSGLCGVPLPPCSSGGHPQGKKPIDSAEFGDDNNLVGWAKQLYIEKRSNGILDPELMTQKSGEAELYQYLRIAFECLDDRPFRRPTMIQVMAMFKELQVDSESDILDDMEVVICASELDMGKAMILEMNTLFCKVVVVALLESKSQVHLVVNFSRLMRSGLRQLIQEYDDPQAFLFQSTSVTFPLVFCPFPFTYRHEGLYRFKLL
ncbi:hypothetical protein D5086_003988 [Populus alba]|uniref:Uncharacterized protein n=1 Tax=Populus alba TaxID=43335 RepID=A0ACC4D5V9_POPAL